MQTTTDELHQDPATLFAIAVAAHQAKNRDLERSAKRQLRAKFGVRIVAAVMAVDVAETQERMSGAWSGDGTGMWDERPR